MLAQSAVHEAAASIDAVAMADGARAKKKKLTPLADLFPNILSQAQRNQGTRAAEAGKAPAAHKSAGRESELAAAGVKKGVGEIKRPQEHNQPSAAFRQLATGAETHAADESRARKKGDKRPGQDAEGLAGFDPGQLKAPDEPRRAKPAKEASADEPMAIRASRNALTAVARAGESTASTASTVSAVAPKAKSAREESDPSIDEKKRGGSQSETKMSLLDLRRSVESRREASAKVEPKADEASPKEAIRELKPSGQGRELVRDLSLESRQAGDLNTFGKAESAPAASGGRDFQSMLAERMREAWNGEIVKSAHIVLRDGDAGTIRLRLKPESLGNVKVELNLSDNNISGRILVESDEAKTAFEKNMNQLADAFMQGGFDSARLEVSVGGGSGGGASGKGSGDASGPFYSERLRNAVGSSADPATAATAYARRGGAVDILA